MGPLIVVAALMNGFAAEHTTSPKDPHLRFQELVHQSEDFRPIERRPGWIYENPPSHLTPERIHCGIVE